MTNSRRLSGLNNRQLLFHSLEARSLRSRRWQVPSKGCEGRLVRGFPPLCVDGCFYPMPPHIVFPLCTSLCLNFPFLFILCFKIFICGLKRHCIKFPNFTVFFSVQFSSTNCIHFAVQQISRPRSSVTNSLLLPPTAANNLLLL